MNVIQNYKNKTVLNRKIKILEIRMQNKQKKYIHTFIYIYIYIYIYKSNIIIVIYVPGYQILSQLIIAYFLIHDQPKVDDLGRP
jgi:hypothetical protein